MIKFFRKIRQDLVMENNSKKYFKYAIGEIILVVIGILIALSINNWNEGRKNKIFEGEILTQIRANLMKDRITLNLIKSTSLKAISSSDKLLEHNYKTDAPDSLKYWLGDVILFNRFQPLTNAYEVLKSKGLDQVSNKQLRFLLGQYYDDTAHNMTDAAKDLKISFINDWLPILKIHVVDFKFNDQVILEDNLILSDSKEIRNILILNKDNFGGSIDYISQGLDLIEKIMEFIKTELD